MKKKSFLILLTLIIVKSSFAQLKSPNASPRSNISQIIGLVSVNLDYSRPSKKSREIFGGLVPYNKIPVVLLLISCSSRLLVTYVSL